MVDYKNAASDAYDRSQQYAGQIYKDPLKY